MVYKADYLAFGTRYGEEADDDFDEEHGFTGKEYDPDTGLYYYNAIWYDPDTGRFVEEDPIQSEWLEYFNKKSRGRTEKLVKVILAEEAKADNDGKKVELVFKPRNLDEIEENNWYSRKNRVERGRKSDADIASQSEDDTDHKFENEDGVNWYWYLMETGGVGFGVQVGAQGGKSLLSLLSKGMGVLFPDVETIYDLEGLSTNASAALLVGSDFNLDDPQHPIGGINIGSVGGSVSWNLAKIIPLTSKKQ